MGARCRSRVRSTQSGSRGVGTRDSGLGIRRAGIRPRVPSPGRSIHPGDWIVRMDQPYTATVRTLLSTQKYKADDPPPYDDTGWTLDLLRHVETMAIADSAVFSKPMQMLN